MVRNAWTIIGLWFVASIIIGLAAGRLIDRMGGGDDDGLIAWNNPELQNHPLWWCDYKWDPKTCPHPSVAGNGGRWTCDACGKDGC